MSDYIAREEAKTALNIEAEISTAAQKALEDAIDGIPADDVEPVVHGCWIEKPFLMGISRFCSKCGDNFGMPHGVYRYCPTCGARMELEVEEEY